MKLIKKIAAIMFAFMMVFSLSTNAKAETLQGSITINNAKKGETYKIYRILDLDSYNYPEGKPDKGNYSYTYKQTGKNITEWKKFVDDNTGEKGKKFFDVTDETYVTAKTTDGEEIAKAALDFVTNASIQAEEEQTPVTDGTISFRNLPLGYYLVESSVGALCGLTTTNSNVEINEKNGVPSVEKTVYDGHDYASSNYADIGETVAFLTKVYVTKGVKNLVLHDKISPGLVLKENTYESLSPTSPRFLIQASNAENTFHKDLRQDEEYTFNKTTNGFTLSFKKDFLEELENYDYEISVQYTATLTKDAAITFTNLINPNKNKTWLTYGNNTKSNDSETSTYTFGVPVFKYTGANKPLADAQFALYAKDGVTQIELIQTDDIDGVPTYRRFIEGDSNKDKVTNIKTNENGRFNITGLNLGTYYLEETEAPKGYNKLTDKIKVTFTKDGVDGATFVRLLQGTSETNVINVKNNTGSILPSTGGMGTTLIYLIGGALVLGSGFVLANKKRAKAK